MWADRFATAFLSRDLSQCTSHLLCTGADGYPRDKVRGSDRVDRILNLLNSSPIYTSKTRRNPTEPHGILPSKIGPRIFPNEAMDLRADHCCVILSVWNKF